MLLLSLSVHAALVMLVQPRSYPVPREITVISARLVESGPSQPPPPVAPPKEELSVPPAEPPVAPPVPEPIPVAAPEPQQPPPPPAAPTEEKAAEPVPAPEQAKPAEEGADVVARPATSPLDSLPSVPVMVDTHWYEARQLDVQPKASQPINPVYPPDAVRRSQQGTVKLKLRVNEFGAVQDAEVEEADPPGIFDDSALEAFKKARFEPAIKDGRPVRALIYIRVRYELGGG
jgi:protein TonB